MVSTINSLIVKELIQRYQNTKNCLIVSYQGVKSLEAAELRKDLKKKDIRLEVVRNTLASLAFKEMGLDGIERLLEGPSALIVGKTVDSVALAKAVVEWSKKVPSLKVKGGMVEGRIISIPEVEALSKLPSKPVLHTQLATLMKAPLNQLVMILSAPLHNLMGTLDAFKSKKESEGTSTTGG